eukprot:scaffold12.g7996.t1
MAGVVASYKKIESVSMLSIMAWSQLAHRGPGPLGADGDHVGLQLGALEAAALAAFTAFLEEYTLFFKELSEETEFRAREVGAKPALLLDAVAAMREALLLTGELAERWGQPALLIDSPEAYASIDQAVKFFVDLSSLPMFQQEAETANAGAALQRQLLRAALLCARKLFESPPSPEKLAGALQHHVALLQQAVPLDARSLAAAESVLQAAVRLAQLLAQAFVLLYRKLEPGSRAPYGLAAAMLAGAEAFLRLRAQAQRLCRAARGASGSTGAAESSALAGDAAQLSVMALACAGHLLRGPSFWELGALDDSDLPAAAYRSQLHATALAVGRSVPAAVEAEGADTFEFHKMLLLVAATVTAALFEAAHATDERRLVLSAALSLDSAAVQCLGPGSEPCQTLAAVLAWSDGSGDCVAVQRARALGLRRSCANLACTNLAGRSEAQCKGRLCGGCRIVRFCCEACSREAWRAGGHKAACAVLAERRRDGGAMAARSRQSTGAVIAMHNAERMVSVQSSRTDLREFLQSMQHELRAAQAVHAKTSARAPTPGRATPQRRATDPGASPLVCSSARSASRPLRSSLLLSPSSGAPAGMPSGGASSAAVAWPTSAAARSLAPLIAAAVGPAATARGAAAGLEEQYAQLRASIASSGLAAQRSQADSPDSVPHLTAEPAQRPLVVQCDVGCDSAVGALQLTAAADLHGVLPRGQALHCMAAVPLPGLLHADRQPGSAAGTSVSGSLEGSPQRPGARQRALAQAGPWARSASSGGSRASPDSDVYASEDDVLLGSPVSRSGTGGAGSGSEAAASVPASPRAASCGAGAHAEPTVTVGEGDCECRAKVVTLLLAEAGDEHLAPKAPGCRSNAPGVRSGAAGQEQPPQAALAAAFPATAAGEDADFHDTSSSCARACSTGEDCVSTVVVGPAVDAAVTAAAAREPLPARAAEPAAGQACAEPGGAGAGSTAPDGGPDERRRAALHRLKSRTLRRSLQRPSTAAAGEAVGQAPGEVGDSTPQEGDSGASGPGAWQPPADQQEKAGGRTRTASRVMQRSDTALLAQSDSPASAAVAVVAQARERPSLEDQEAADTPAQQQARLQDDAFAEGEATPSAAPKPFLRRRSQTVPMQRLPDYNRVRPRTDSSWRDNPRAGQRAGSTSGSDGGLGGGSLEALLGAPWVGHAAAALASLWDGPGPFPPNHLHPAWSLRLASAPPPPPPLRVNKTALWHQPLLLDPRAIQRGVLSYGDPARLRRAVHAMLAGQRVVVAGFEDWVRAAFPAANVSFVNTALGGTSVDLYSVCIERMLPAGADLVIVDFSVSRGAVFKDCDCVFKPSVISENRANYERLLRKLLALPGRPAVVVMNPYAWRSEPKGLYFASLENDRDVVGSYYGLPILSIRAAAYRLMAQNRSGYRVDGTVKDPPPGYQGREQLFYYDSVHPWGPTGHRYMAELLTALVQSTAGSLLAAPWGGAPEQAAVDEPLPPPMIPGNAGKKASVCLLRKAFQPAVVATAGFEWVNDRPGATSEGQAKWGYAAIKPGATADVLVDTRIQDHVHPNETEKTQAVLGYLASYERMGRARVECVANCSCEASTIDALWEQRVSLFQMHAMQVTQHEACRLRVTVLNATSDPGGGTRVKLSGLIVLPAGAGDFQPERIKVVREKASHLFNI